MRRYGIAYRHVPLMPFGPDKAELAKLNPIARVPALQLANGASIQSASYTIIGPNSFTKTGTIDLSAASKLSATIAGIPMVTPSAESAVRTGRCPSEPRPALRSSANRTLLTPISYEASVPCVFARLVALIA